MPQIKTNIAAVAVVRSPARSLLAERLAVRERAQARIDELRAADRRLDGLRREAERLAADVATADSETSAADLALALVRVQAKIAASGSERDRITAAMFTTGQELFSATVAARAEVTAVLHEELDDLAREIEALNRQLAPLHNRMAGLRVWAMGASHSGGSDEHRAAHNHLMSESINAIARLCPFVMAPAGDAEAAWEALAENLMADADAGAR